MRYAVDRVETTSTVWLGMTLGCAVCHNHKFDPVTQKEFYGLFAFFNGVAENAMDGNALLPPPLMKLPTTEQSTKLAALDVELAEVRKSIGEQLAEVKYEEPVDAASPGTEPREFVWFDDDPPNGANLQGDTPWEFVTKDAAPVFSGNKASKRKAAGLSQHFFTGANPGLNIVRGTRCSLMSTSTGGHAEGDHAAVQRWLVGASGVLGRKRDSVGWREHPRACGDGAAAGTGVVGATGSARRESGTEGGVVAEWVGVHAACRDGLLGQAGIVTKVPQAGQSFESQKGWEAYDKTLAQSKTPQNIRDLIKIEADKRNDGQKAEIRNYFLEHVYAKTREVFGPLHTKLADLQKQKTDIDGAIPATMVMADMPQPRETFLLIRGAYDKKGEKVEAGVPSIFPPMSNDVPKNRLGLAKWLVRRDHPLTARVTVNRFWQQFFGTGLVKTSEDFGSQGRCHRTRIARLAGGRVHGLGLGHAADAEADGAVVDVPAVVAIDAGPARARSVERTARTRSPVPVGRGDDPRQRPVFERTPRRANRRQERQTLPTGRVVGGGGVRRQHDLGLQAGRGGRLISTQPVHVLEANLAAADAAHVRRAVAGDVLGPPCPHEHTSASADSDERQAVRGGRAAHGPATVRRSRAIAGSADRAGVPAGDRSDADGGRDRGGARCLSGEQGHVRGERRVGEQAPGLWGLAPREHAGPVEHAAWTMLCNWC